MSNKLEHAHLGKASEYIDTYAPELLFPVPRLEKRQEIGIAGKLPFYGIDIWNAWEISWLNQKGKPIVAIAEFRIPAHSVNIIESKSFKLYLNSFNQSKFDSIEQVAGILEKDLSACAGKAVSVNLVMLKANAPFTKVVETPGICIDDLDVNIDCYTTNSDLLESDPENLVEETLVSHLLKSNCPVTGQPDWGSVVIQYKGHQLDHHALLKYVISFRQHTEFHEQCVERIFMDITRLINPEHLTVSARYVRRGGLDINPYRSSSKQVFTNKRLARQ